VDRVNKVVAYLLDLVVSIIYTAYYCYYYSSATTTTTTTCSTTERNIMVCLHSCYLILPLVVCNCALQRVGSSLPPSSVSIICFLVTLLLLQYCLLSYPPLAVYFAHSSDRIRTHHTPRPFLYCLCTCLAMPTASTSTGKSGRSSTLLYARCMDDTYFR
jgi:hypothetical protein